MPTVFDFAPVILGAYNASRERALEKKKMAQQQEQFKDSLLETQLSRAQEGYWKGVQNMLEYRKKEWQDARDKRLHDLAVEQDRERAALARKAQMAGHEHEKDMAKTAYEWELPFREAEVDIARGNLGVNQQRAALEGQRVGLDAQRVQHEIDAYNEQRETLRRLEEFQTRYPGTDPRPYMEHGPTDFMAEGVRRAGLTGIKGLLALTNPFAAMIPAAVGIKGAFDVRRELAPTPYDLEQRAQVDETIAAYRSLPANTRSAVMSSGLLEGEKGTLMTKLVNILANENWSDTLKEQEAAPVRDRLRQLGVNNPVELILQQMAAAQQAGLPLQ